LKFSAKKVAFLVSSGKNQISPLLAPSWKNVGKISQWSPSEKNSSDAHDIVVLCSFTKIEKTIPFEDRIEMVNINKWISRMSSSVRSDSHKT